MKARQRSQETSDDAVPMRFLAIGNYQQIPVPLIRVTTCGLLTIEIVETVISTNPPLARYISLTPDQLRGRGTAPALTLLKLLVSCPERFASKDWLIEQFCRDREELFSTVRLDNIVSQLRGLLCPPAYEDLRTHLVAHVRSSPASGDGYQLASYPLIWVDHEALTWQVEQAARMERFGDDPLFYWERAYEIARRGSYLPDERYSDWAASRRGEIAGALQQSIQALARLYLARHGEAGEEEALMLLRSYWHEHAREEDVLRPLMELLGKRERYQEALDYYEQLQNLLKEDEHQPDPRTLDLVAYLRGKQIQRQPIPPISPPSSLLATPTVPGTIDIFVEATKDEGDIPLIAAKEAFSQPLLTETRHLIGRDGWLAQMVHLVERVPAKKVIVLQGPVGMGKSSELARLASFFQRDAKVPYQVIWFALPPMEQQGNPDTALDVFLRTLLSECGVTPLPAEISRAQLLTALFKHLRQQQHPTVVLLDNAECLFDEHGKLASCWETFLTHCLRSQHQTTFFLATKEWHGWPGREGIFIAETFVPPLTTGESMQLLHRLGLGEVSIEHLSILSERMVGIPLLLEWAAKLVHDPLLLDDWQGIDENAETAHLSEGDHLTRRLMRILEDPTLLGTHIATRLSPLLQRLIEKHLSLEARCVVELLAVIPLPLGKPALQILCPRPNLLKELRDASLLASYTNRVQLLPIVASIISQQLPLEQQREAEVLVIQAYMAWLNEGNLDMREAGNVVTELAMLLLKHHRLLEAAELLLYHGWLSFNLGNAPRLALFSQMVLDQIGKLTRREDMCAGFVLCQTFSPFLAELAKQTITFDYQHIAEAFFETSLILPARVERSIGHRLVVKAMNDLLFDDAQNAIDAYKLRLAAQNIIQPERYPMLIQEQILLRGTWCEYLEEQGEREQARVMREETITLQREYIEWLSAQKEGSQISESLRQRGLAYHFTDLGYHLNRISHYEEALQIIEQAITLHEHGYGYIGTLAASYGEKSQILMELGRFQEALLFDEKALLEIQRCIEMGDELSREEKWIYQVNRGRLYLRIGKVNEAEKLLQEALPHIQAKRRVYRMFAKEALEEIAQQRSQTPAFQSQLEAS